MGERKRAAKPEPADIMYRRMLRAITRALENVGEENLGYWTPRALATWIAPSASRVAKRALSPPQPRRGKKGRK